MIVKYSLINSITNPVPLYSVIKPLTSSEGLSAKSKGRRLLSASKVINTKLNKGNITKIPKDIKFNKKYFNLTLFKKKILSSVKRTLNKVHKKSPGLPPAISPFWSTYYWTFNPLLK